MPTYKWPDAKDRSVIGTRVSRVDGPDKVSGRAKYTYDFSSNDLLYGLMARSPYAHCKVVSIDTSAAEKMPGVKAVKVVQGPGTEIFWAGDDIVGVAAVDEGTAEDAVRAIKIEYQVLPHMVDDGSEPKGAQEDTGPLSMDDLINMFQNQVDDDDVIARVKRDGITFQPTQEFLDAAGKEGVDKNVLAVIRTAKVKPAVEKPKSPYKKQAAKTQGDPAAAFKQAAVVSEGLYGIPVIVHCCLEPHGAVAAWGADDHIEVQISTQNVSGMAGQMAQPLGVPASNIHMRQQNVGGGFGSKFSPDRWSIVAAQLSKQAGGAPVKMMLERRAELEIAGARPSAFARVKVGASKEGELLVWQSNSWATGGPGGGGMPPIPYIFDIPNQRLDHTSVATNAGPARAWRAPNHPQAAVLTMCPLDDLAARLHMDPMAFILKNIDMAGPRAKTYTEEFAKADELMGWKKRWHPRGNKTAGPIKQGLGLSMHTWGGRGHASNCDLTVYPDGAVEIKMGTQDLGTGTRTIILMVASETLGIPISQINLLYGDSKYPVSGGSGGSTTAGGVTSSTRRASVNALTQVFAKAAPALNATPDQLSAKGGKVFVTSDPSQSLTWKDACARIGAMPITVHGQNPNKAEPPDLTNSGVGGVQMADVSVDIETGIVRVNKMVAVQDCGLVINLKTAESQCKGALIMGISYSLYEEKVLDPVTGRMLNADMEHYRLAGYGDIPELVVHMMTGKGYDERGVIGLGEPPVISPGAAISNAVANAIGVRVPFLPLTPDRVLAALDEKSSAKGEA